MNNRMNKKIESCI